MSDAAILVEVKRRLSRFGSMGAKVGTLCKRLEKKFDWRDVERVLGDAIKSGELHVTNGYVWVPGPAPVFGEPPPAKKRKKKEKLPDPRQVSLLERIS